MRGTRRHTHFAGCPARGPGEWPGGEVRSHRPTPEELLTRNSGNAPPAFASLAAYGAGLGDVALWLPHVTRALARHALPAGEIVAGTVGSFPTFLTDRHVVKLFAEVLSGAACYRAELALHRLFVTRPDIPAARLVAHGRLFDEGWPWPYLITERLGGRAWSDAPPSPEAGASLACQLGQTVCLLHDTPPPAGAVRGPDTLVELHRDCAARHRSWGTLPPLLVTQIDGYVLDPGRNGRLLHADMHADHVFITGESLVGIIDWGDAIVADPYYELPALHLGTFRGSKPLLRAFLEGYGWPIGADFARRAMSMTLLHEFDVLAGARDWLDLEGLTGIEQLAACLWDVS